MVPLSVYIKILLKIFSYQLSSPFQEYKNKSLKLKFGTYITLSMNIKFQSIF